MASRLLCVGDMHLGRRPSRLPEDLGALRPADLGPAAVWLRTVDEAISREVDAVLLAGDVIESREDRFAAFGVLEEGVRRLLERGIPVYGVTGNHDIEALPRLAGRLPGFELLGQDGRWSDVEIPARSGEALRVLGWSFPRSGRVTDSPLGGFEFVEDARPAIGLLHCDLDASGSAYAPVSRRELESHRLDAWLLGHVHKPDALGDSPRPIGYLGSIAPLDPGEPGPHGPWLAEVRGHGVVAMEQLPLAPLRYERIDVALEALEAGDVEELADRLSDRILQAIVERHEEISPELSDVRLLACRIRLTGRCADHRGVAGLIGQGRLESLHKTVGDVRCYVERIEDAGAAAIDLEQLARESDPPGLLARRLIAVQGGTDAGLELIEKTRQALQVEQIRSSWLALGHNRQPDVGALLLRAGMRAIEELLAQRDEARSRRS